MHSILFTVMHSHGRLLPVTSLEGKMMMDCVCEDASVSRMRGRRGTRFQVFHGLNEEQTCTMQDREGEKIIIWR